MSTLLVVVQPLRKGIRKQHLITVTNRRTKPEGYAVWEIHPVMALHVDN
jgi:hypothetical protein